MTTRAKFRQTIRQLRQKISEREQAIFADKLCESLKVRLKNHGKKVNKIALYLPNDGELDTTLFINWCWQHNIQVYLPVVHPFSQGNLLFLNYQPTTTMLANQYGILEPKLNVNNIALIHELDVIFTPLVAFDQQGNRLGMGGGFYDRTLAQVNTSTTAIIGLAHQCQKVEQLPTEIWDIPLPEIITPTQRYIFSHS